MLMKCSECGHDIDQMTPVPRYDYRGLGIPVLLLNAVEEARCPNCKTVESTLIPNLKGLIASAAAERIGMPIRLNGTEIRFLREALNLNGVQLGMALGVRNEFISKCEHEAETLGEHLERNFRAWAYLLLRKHTPIKLKIEKLLTMSFDDQPRSLRAIQLVLRLVPMRSRKQRSWKADPLALKKTG